MFVVPELFKVKSLVPPPVFTNVVVVILTPLLFARLELAIVAPGRGAPFNCKVRLVEIVAPVELAGRKLQFIKYVWFGANEIVGDPTVCVIAVP